MVRWAFSGYYIYCTSCQRDTDHHIAETRHNIRFNPERHVLTTVYCCNFCDTRSAHVAVINPDQNVIDDDNDN